MDSAVKAATNQQQWYVTISRGRKGVKIFTADKGQLRENIPSPGSSLTEPMSEVRRFVPLHGSRADPGTATPLMGQATAGTITPLMGPAAPATVTPLLGPADRGTIVSLTGPADPGTATPLMLPSR